MQSELLLIYYSIPTFDAFEGPVVLADVSSRWIAGVGASD
jgi:hypothetical protein